MELQVFQINISKIHQKHENETFITNRIRTMIIAFENLLPLSNFGQRFWKPF